jgi:hypothetical protein
VLDTQIHEKAECKILILFRVENFVLKTPNFSRQVSPKVLVFSYGTGTAFLRMPFICLFVERKLSFHSFVGKPHAVPV